MAWPHLIDAIQLSGRVALVTGAGAGLGQAIARELAALGAQVAVLDVDAQAGARTAQALPQAMALGCNVAEAEHVQHAVAQVLQRWGQLDVVVNCAGVASAPGMPFTQCSPADWQHTLNINLMGAVHVCGAARDALLASPAGRVVNVSSITGVISAPYMPAYSVSKAALISLTKVLARELAPHGVTANAVCPGFIWTPMWDALGQTMAAREGHHDGRAVFDQRIQTHVPMQRPQTEGDVAHCVAFLCGQAARHITGQVIGVDGGVTI